MQSVGVILLYSLFKYHFVLLALVGHMLCLLKILIWKIKNAYRHFYTICTINVVFNFEYSRVGKMLAHGSSYPKIGLKCPNASTASLLCFLPLKMTKTPKNSGGFVVVSLLCNLSWRSTTKKMPMVNIGILFDSI